MFDLKRFGFLLILALFVGLSLVYLRTKHLQSMSRIMSLRQDELQLRHEIWQQRTQLSEQIDSPKRLKEMVESLGLSVRPEGRETTSRGDSQRWIHR